MSQLHAELDRALAWRASHGAPGGTSGRVVAAGEGWRVADVLCTAGPEDLRFEERHEGTSVSVVVAGSFGYHSAAGRELLTPGALLLGNHGQCFECGHEHGRGDRCISIQYAPDLFDRLAANAGAGQAERYFRHPRLPPLRATAGLVARAAAALDRGDAAHWEELALTIGARAVELAAGLPPGGTAAPPGIEAAVADAVRRIERAPGADHRLAGLARRGGFSPYHFLRAFERVTGVTPHQFVLRARLRAAALALAAGRARVLDVALDAGFGDLSHFNRSFRAEFGAPPTTLAAQLREAGGTMPRSRA